MASEQDVLRILQTGTMAERLAVLQALLKSPLADASPRLDDVVTLLCDSDDPGLRFWARRLITKRRSKPFGLSTPPSIASNVPVEILLQKLKAVESTYVSLEVIKKLCAAHDETALQPLIDYLARCKDPVQVSFLTKQLGISFPREELLPVLMPYLKHPDDRVVANTIEGLEAIGSPKSVALFAQLLDHRSNRVKANAAKAISQADPEKTFQVLVMMMRTPGKPHYAISACYAAKILNNPLFLPYIAELLSNDLVFDDALHVMGAIGGEDAKELLQQAMSLETDAARRDQIGQAWARLENPEPPEWLEAAGHGPAASPDEADAHRERGELAAEVVNPPRSPAGVARGLVVPAPRSPSKRAAADPRATGQPSVEGADRPMVVERVSKRREHEVFCSSCGATHHRQADRCPSCGAPNTVILADTRGAGREAAGQAERGKRENEIYCPNCGNIVNRDAELCVKCGVRIRKEERTLGKAAGDDDADRRERRPTKKEFDEKFCSSCGKIIKIGAMICPGCGVVQQAIPGERFCYACGNTIKSNARDCPHCGVPNPHPPSGGHELPATDTPVDYQPPNFVTALLWFFLCFPVGYVGIGQPAKFWSSLFILVITFGYGSIFLIFDYWMCFSVAQRRPLKPSEWFPTK